jgi:cytochrome c5
MSQQDSQLDSGLYKSFALVLGALVCFTLFILVIANMVSPASDRNQDPLVANNIKRSIEPIGRSNVRAVVETAEAESASDAAAEETPAAEGEAASQTEEAESTDDDAGSDQPADTDAAQAETAETTEATTTTGVVDDSASDSQAADAVNTAAGVEPARVDTSVDIPVKVRAVVATNCAGCHQSGVQGAQRNDDTEAWQGLAAKGIEALTASVINGLGAMPARAESPLDDAELKLAVQHMINKNLAGVAPQASDSDAAAATTETTGETASTEAASTESEATDSSGAQASDKDAAAEETAAVAEPAAVPIPDNVKAAVDTLCAACHISGVGNAPKYGDKAAWDARMANGLDAVTASAIAGKGAMPARGGSQLTDEEIRLAVQYMLTK